MLIRLFFTFNYFLLKGCYKKTFIKPQIKSTTTESTVATEGGIEVEGKSIQLAKSSESTTIISSNVVTTSVSNSSITTQAKGHPGTVVKFGKRKSMDRDILNRLKELQRMKTGLYAKLVEQQKTLLEKLKGIYFWV